MDNLILGKYLPYDTLVHRLDPRAKILMMLMIMVAIFIPAGFWGYLIIGIFAFVGLMLAKIKIKSIIKAFKPMWFMMLFLFVINVLEIKTGKVLVEFKWFTIYDDALFQTLYIMVRLLLMITITTILTATTKPLDLTLAIEDLLTPFKVIKVPAHEIAMMISIALRFIPTLIEETQRIMKAQASRGVDLEEGKLKEKIIAILSLIVPLFVTAIQRAGDLANAMEAKGYIPGAKRSRYKQLRMRSMDYSLLGVCALMIVALIVVGQVL